MKTRPTSRRTAKTPTIPKTPATARTLGLVRDLLSATDREPGA